MKGKNYKRKAAVISAIAITAALAAYGTAAYFTAEDTATNVITAGNVKIQLVERMKSGDELVPFTDAVGVMPGARVSKIAQVENTGSQPAWIRVSVAKAVELAQGVEGEIDLSLVTLDINTEYWTERDGFYYYNTALEPGKTTEPLFTEVAFDESMSNLYQDSRAVITVNAYATQKANNGTSAADAKGWPEV